VILRGGEGGVNEAFTGYVIQDEKVMRR